MGYGTVDKIFLVFRRPWWTKEWGGVSFLSDISLTEGNWEDKILGFYTMRDQPNVLEGWLNGPAARRQEALPDDLVLKTCSDLLRNTVAQEFNYEEPISIIRTKWYSNPRFRGSYSYRSLKSKEHDVWATNWQSPNVTRKVALVSFLLARQLTVIIIRMFMLQLKPDGGKPSVYLN